MDLMFSSNEYFIGDKMPIEQKLVEMEIGNSVAMVRGVLDRLTIDWVIAYRVDIGNGTIETNYLHRAGAPEESIQFIHTLSDALKISKPPVVVIPAEPSAPPQSDSGSALIIKSEDSPVQ